MGPYLSFGQLFQALDDTFRQDVHSNRCPQGVGGQLVLMNELRPVSKEEETWQVSDVIPIFNKGNFHLDKI